MTTTTQQAPKSTGNPYKMDLLRFTTAGSVDDGKSTLIGRLLYDSKSIFEDQMEALERTTEQSGEEEVNLALLTDGLRAEREQKITIDVAYRYFATPKRKFIIADTPGHEQYTRNMVTGASTADLAIVLVDARNGVLTQSKRHAFIASLLQIPHVVVAINKMDLEDYSEERYNEIIRDFEGFAGKLEVDDITYIPISALKGDNIVDKSENMSWYNGPTLLHYLENVNISSPRNLIDFRLPIQYVIRPHQDFRGFAGNVVSGKIRRGEKVMVLPSRMTSTINTIQGTEGETDEATTGDNIVVELDDDIDISRGDMLVRPNNVPHISTRFDAYICWMNQEEMDPNRSYIIKQTSRTAQALINRVIYHIDVETLHRQDKKRLALNEIARVEITASTQLFYDAYKDNRYTGSFILIDPNTNATVAAGMVRSASTGSQDPAVAADAELIARAEDIEINDDFLVVKLTDGRILQAPLSMYPELAEATKATRKDCTLSDNGLLISWPALDLKISVPELFEL